MPRVRENNNKPLRRFYEPLMLLYILDRTQGEHTSRPTLEKHHLKDVSPLELQRRFVDAFAYVCDFDKGGDPTTSIWLSKAPLTYYVASNTLVKEKVKIFQRELTRELALFFEDDARARGAREASIVAKCVSFSRKRLENYHQNLVSKLKECLDGKSDETCVRDLMALQKDIDRKKDNLHNVCIYCEKLIRSTKFDFVRRRASTNESNGVQDCKFAQIRHFVGRLAYHVKMVEILVATAVRLPELFISPEFEFVEPPPVKRMDLGLRHKDGLEGILSRMINHDPETLEELRKALNELQRNFDVEDILQKEFNNRCFKPLVHCEVRLLEYIYQNRDEVRLYENDRYIGCSKPACYCCSLYINAHPGNFVRPGSHQKIYVKWLPPTSVEDAGYEQRIHELAMLNKMIESIRVRTIDQIRSCTGPRRKHYDSITGDTFTELVAHLKLNEDEDSARWSEDDASELPALDRTSSSETDSDATAVLSGQSGNSSEEQLSGHNQTKERLNAKRVPATDQISASLSSDGESEDDGGIVLIRRGKGKGASKFR